MGKVEQYRSVIKKIIQEHADLMNSQPVQGQFVDCVFDEKSDQYLLLKYGWVRGSRQHYTKLHIRLYQEKIWIEEDLTEDGFAIDLLYEGIPKEEIVLGFNVPGRQDMSEYVLA